MKYGIEYDHYYNTTDGWRLVRKSDEDRWSPVKDDDDEPKLFDTMEQACREIRRHGIAFPRSLGDTGGRPMRCRIVKVNVKLTTTYDVEQL